MFPKPDNKKVDNEKETNCTKTVTELETSLIEKTKLEDTYLNQRRYARVDLENLQKHIQRRIDEEVTREKAKMITGPALLAAIPGNTKMPAQIITPTPTDIAAPRPNSRASLVLVLLF